MRLVCFGAVCVMMLGCSGEAATAIPEASPPVNTEGDNVPSSDGVRGDRVSGVWVFSHEQSDYDLAALNGAAIVTRDCLLVNGHVVIWPEALLPDAQNAVTRLQAGQQVSASLAGSETQREHPSIAENCPGFPMWFAGPGTLQ
jgi:hypothetical protein